MLCESCASFTAEDEEELLAEGMGEAWDRAERAA